MFAILLDKRKNAGRDDSVSLTEIVVDFWKARVRVGHVLTFEANA